MLSKKNCPKGELVVTAGYIEETAGGAERPLRHLYPVFTLSRMPFPSFKDTVKRTEVCLLIRFLVDEQTNLSYSQLEAHAARA